MSQKLKPYKAQLKPYRVYAGTLQHAVEGEGRPEIHRSLVLGIGFALQGTGFGFGPSVSGLFVWVRFRYTGSCWGFSAFGNTHLVGEVFGFSIVPCRDFLEFAIIRVPIFGLPSQHRSQYIYIYIYMRICVYVYTRKYVYVYAYMYIYMYMYEYIYIYIFICT